MKTHGLYVEMWQRIKTRSWCRASYWERYRM